MTIGAEVMSKGTWWVTMTGDEWSAVSPTLTLAGMMDGWLIYRHVRTGAMYRWSKHASSAQRLI